MKNKLITVGMPVFNGERTIEKAIQSVLNQEFNNFELIISDNCSTDSTEQICEKYASIDPRIVYTRQNRNVGMYKNFLHLLQKAKGEYFLFNAADDELSRTSLINLYECLEKNKDCGIASPATSFYKDGNYIYDGVNRGYVSENSWLRQITYSITVIDNSMYMGLHRTDLIKKIYKSYDPEENEGEIYRLDWIQMLVMLHNNKVKIINDANWRREYSGIPDSASPLKKINTDIFKKNSTALSCYKSAHSQLYKQTPNQVLCKTIFLIFVFRDYYANFRGKCALIWKRSFISLKNAIRK